jgi:hemoglobin/transferrin/lactoferrin receptor protein
MLKFWILIILLLYTTQAKAQGLEQSDSLQQVVISANKTQEQKRDIPNQVEVLTARNIRDLTPQTLADVLQNSGTAFVQKSQQGGGSPVLRGFEANKVLIVLDGVRMNNAIYRSGHLQNIITLDPAMIDRFEVLYGSGSVTYGSDAIGGVMSVFTRKPRLRTENEKAYQFGAFTRYSTANQGITTHLRSEYSARKWASLLSITANQFGDLRSGARAWKDYQGFGNRDFYVVRQNGNDVRVANLNPNKQIGSGYKQLDLLHKLVLLPKPGVQHTLNTQYSTSTDVPRYDRLTEVRDGNPRFSEWYYGPQKRFLASWQTELEIKKRWADLVRITPAFQAIQESRNDRAFGKLPLNTRSENLHIGSMNFDLFKEFGEHELRYGAELFHNQLTSVGVQTDIVSGATTAIQSRYPNGRFQTTGLFVTHRWEAMGKKLIFSDGLRHSTTHMDVKYDGDFIGFTPLLDVKQRSQTLNFNLGVTSNLDNGFRVAAAYNTGFRAPNIDDAGKIFENISGQINIPNAGLKPEQIHSAELNLGQKIGKQLEVNATAFHSNLRDAIATRPVANAAPIILQGDTLLAVQSANIARARVQGLSAQTLLRVGYQWTFTANCQYTHGRDITGQSAKPLDHIPPFLFFMKAAYSRSKLRASAEILHNGAKRLKDYSDSGEDNLQYATPTGIPAWTVVHLRGSYRIDEKLQVQLAVENLLDQRYRAFASGINGGGRGLVLEVRWGL